MGKIPKFGYSYLSVLQSINDAVIVRDLSGKIFFINYAAEKLFGYPSEEIIGQEVEIIIPSIKANEEKKLVENIIWGEQVENYETERIDKQNNTIYVSVSLSALKDEEGKIIGITKVIRNITEKKKSEGKFQALLESAPDAMIIVNKFGQIVLANAQTEILFGYDRSSLIGQEIEILIPARFSKHAAHRKHFFEDSKVRKMGEGLELFGLRKDGSEFPVEISLSPLKLDEGMFVSAAIRDISLRKKSEAKFKELLESAPDAMVIVNKEGNIQLINTQTEKLFDYKKEELIGKKVEVLIPERFKNNHPSHRHGFFAHPKTRSMGVGIELYARKKDGAEFPVEISLSPIETEDGVLVSAAIRDISEQRKASLALKEYATRLEVSNQELEQFAYVSSHDLQEPLRNITNYVNLLEKQLKENSNDQSKFFLKVIIQSADRMKILINELLNFSRIGRNRKIEKINCDKVLNEVLADMDFIIQENNAKITIDEMPVININIIEIKQLFQNLISNAIKFKKKDVNPEIHIHCENKNTEWEFSVRDNGIGIKEEYFKKLFLIFQRLHSEDEYPGTGIGLSTCKKIVELNKGKIWVNSKQNVGSTFYFTIPK